MALLFLKGWAFFLKGEFERRFVISINTSMYRFFYFVFHLNLEMFVNRVMYG